jgi:hypothetical protein
MAMMNLLWPNRGMNCGENKKKTGVFMMVVVTV